MFRVKAQQVTPETQELLEMPVVADLETLDLREEAAAVAVVVGTTKTQVVLTVAMATQEMLTLDLLAVAVLEATADLGRQDLLELREMQTQAEQEILVLQEMLDLQDHHQLHLE